MFPHVHPLFKAKSMELRQQRAERPRVVFSGVVSLRKQAAAWTAPGPFAVAVLRGGLSMELWGVILSRRAFGQSI